MTIELLLLAASVVLGFVYLSAASMAMTKQRGPAWNVSARDGKPPELTGKAARLDRAFQNFKETFPFFVAAIVVHEFVSRTTGQTNSLSLIGAHLYFWARVAYLPIYAFGIPVVRTLIWLASVAGIALVLSTAIFAL